MKKQETYIKHFNNENDALDHMAMKNRTNQVKNWIWAMVDGPDNNFSIVDIRTAIEMGCCYKISYR